MSTACRFCFPDNLTKDGIENANSPVYTTYSTMVLYGNGSTLIDEMINIESIGSIVPGVSVWCEDCKRVSIISYTLHCVLSDNQRDSLIDCTDYYRSMCNMGRLLLEYFDE